MMNFFSALGRITKDPELKQSNGGNPYCRFTLAVDRDQDKADFIPCVAWGKTAENMAQYVIKGQQLLVQGKLQSGSYQDANGNTRYTLDVYAYRIDFLQKPKGAAAAGGDGFEPVPMDPDELPF
jgi:single-strand DNA-binding protein